MKLKKTVAVAMAISGGMIILTLFVGLLVPASVLSKLDKKSGAIEGGASVASPSELTTVQSQDGSQQSGAAQQAVGSSSATNAPGGTAGATSGGSTTGGGGSTGGPPTGGGGGGGGGSTTVNKPVVSIGASPSSITSGNSTTLAWNATNSPTSCTASGAWSGARPANGSAVFSPTATATYTLSCSNAGGSASASVTVTVGAAAPGCGQGGTCHLSDIQGRNTANNCRVAINATGAGLSAYAITASFLSLHQSQKSITSTLCGKVYSSNLRNFTSDHRNGSILGGADYQTWINNFYIGPYN